MLHNLPETIPKWYLMDALAELDGGAIHPFPVSTVYNAEYEGRLYPPDAVVGLAAREYVRHGAGPFYFRSGRGSRCFRILQKAGFKIVVKQGVDEGLGWIFQGNPEAYDVDDYLSRYSYIYWRAPQLYSYIKTGDRCMIWRAGSDRAAVAIGTIVERVDDGGAVKYPECLGADLWRHEVESASIPKVGIQIEEVRLDADTGYLPHRAFQTHPILKEIRIVHNAQGTVFMLQPNDVLAAFRLWGASAEPGSREFPSALEGSRRLRLHFARERSQKLIENKKAHFAVEHAGHVFCEVCTFDFDVFYPTHFKRGFIEVHHLAPLSASDEPRRTTFADLLLVCSNCHRMIHHTKEVEENLSALRAHFALHPMSELLNGCSTGAVAKNLK